MRIGFDAEIFWRQQSGGISVHFSCIIKELLERGHVVYLVAPCCQLQRIYANVHISDLLQSFRVEILEYTTLFSFSSACQEANLDLIHCTYYSFRPKVFALPLVRTFHDAALLRYPGFLLSPRRLARLLLQALSYLTCDGISCVSGFSLTEYKKTFEHLRRLLFLPSLPIGITANASSFCHSCHTIVSTNSHPAAVSTGLRDNVEDHHLLYVGLRGAYKNFSRGLRSIAKVLPLFRSSSVNIASLTVVSSEIMTEKERRQIEDLGIDFQYFRSVSQSALRQLYADSTLLYHTSTYEGFGITVLEAMQCRCPVLAVDIPSVREIAGDTISYSQDGSVDSLAEALVESLFCYPRLISRLDAAYQRSLQYSWAKTASQLEELYARLI